MVLLPITHTPPDGDTIGIEIPAKVKEAIGLDDIRSWVIVSEHNIDEWPNAGPLIADCNDITIRGFFSHLNL